MLRTKDILDEKDPRVRAENTDVEFPLSLEYKNIIPEMLKHLRYSQIEKLSKKYNLRPGMGLAAPQLGINKNFFVVCYERKEGVFDDYVHIDAETPSFAISLLKQYRNYGIGTNLMEQMLKKLKMQGYKQVSLSVQKMNYAVHMYLKVGFEIVDENDEEYIMICKL